RQREGAAAEQTPGEDSDPVAGLAQADTPGSCALDGEYTTARLDQLVIHHHADGGARADKFERDERMLRASLERTPDDPRSVFYLAQTLRDLGRADEAIAQYERRTTLGAWPEEVFYARLQVGVLQGDRGRWAEALASLIAAWQLRPWRMEPVYELASRLRLRGEHQAAYAFAVQGAGVPVSDDWLFVAGWVHRYGLLAELSITAFHTGRFREALAACEELLALPDLPEVYRESTSRNRALCLERLAG
ncbi:glycosyl transferase family 2, partial [Patulibacter sp. NPDC049589]